MNVRRLLAIFLIAVVVFPGTAASWAAGKTLRIAMVLWRGETEAEKGFRDGLKEQGYSVDYVVMNANQDRNELGRLLREDRKSKLETFDYVYTYGTTVSLAAKTIIQDKVPQIFENVADRVGAGIVTSATGSREHIAGTTNGVPLPLQLETALKVHADPAAGDPLQSAREELDALALTSSWRSPGPSTSKS